MDEGENRPGSDCRESEKDRGISYFLDARISSHMDLNFTFYVTAFDSLQDLKRFRIRMKLYTRVKPLRRYLDNVRRRTNAPTNRWEKTRAARSLAFSIARFKGNSNRGILSITGEPISSRSRRTISALIAKLTSRKRVLERASVVGKKWTCPVAVTSISVSTYLTSVEHLVSPRNNRLSRETLNYLRGRGGDRSETLCNNNGRRWRCAYLRFLRESECH